MGVLMHNYEGWLVAGFLVLEEAKRKPGKVSVSARQMACHQKGTISIAYCGGLTKR